jgi:hypothetical protein
MEEAIELEARPNTSKEAAIRNVENGSDINLYQSLFNI